jgi:hypothetical protein
VSSLNSTNANVERIHDVNDIGLRKRDEDSSIHFSLAYLVTAKNTGVQMTVQTNGTIAYVTPNTGPLLQKRHGYDGYTVSQGGILAGNAGASSYIEWDEAIGWAQYTPNNYNAPWWTIWQMSSGPTYWADFAIWNLGGNDITTYDTLAWFQIEKGAFGVYQPQFVGQVLGEVKTYASGSLCI